MIKMLPINKTLQKSIILFALSNFSHQSFADEILFPNITALNQDIFVINHIANVADYESTTHKRLNLKQQCVIRYVVINASMYDKKYEGDDVFFLPLIETKLKTKLGQVTMKQIHQYRTKAESLITKPSEVIPLIKPIDKKLSLLLGNQLLAQLLAGKEPTNVEHYPVSIDSFFNSNPECKP